MKKFAWIFVVLIIVVLGLFGWFRYYYVLGEGVKAGDLNFAVKKGVIFKTYEGKIIQQGFGSNPKTKTFNSYEFEFSVDNEDAYKQLEMNSGKYFELHYKEYQGAIPWRGNSKYVVDRIINMK